MKHVFTFGLVLLVCGQFTVKAQSPTSLTFTYSGEIVNWTVPDGVTSLTIEARGAQGGTGNSEIPGKGATIAGTATVSPHQVLQILVGQKPPSGNGGGGGSFVTSIDNQGLVIAGGGGGAGGIDQYNSPAQGRNGQAATSGAAGGTISGPGMSAAGGMNGQGGQAIAGTSAGGGGGLLTDGADDERSLSGGGKAFIHGGGGGTGSVGGFGGGGGGSGITSGGGGGGYSGGGGGGYNGSFGGGGGSFTRYSRLFERIGETDGNSGNGLVIITYRCPLVAITSQPPSASSVTVGATVIASVSTNGIVNSYQWYKDNVSNPVSGQTSATLTLSNVSVSDAGSYSVVVTSNCNSLTSIAFSLSVAPSQSIRYVKQGGSGDGTSWAVASGDLQSQIDALGTEQVWVAAGTYMPGAPQFILPFKMKDGVAIYGGFPTSGNPGLAERQPTRYSTILSGDVDGDGTLTGNIRRIISAVDLSSTAVLDGFIITGGNNPGGVGGMDISGGSLQVRNCTFINNKGGAGGGMSNRNASPQISNCTFINNSASTGGGMVNDGSNPQLINCSFVNNSATIGGGMYNSESSPQIRNCSFVNNSGSGRAIYNSSTSNPQIINSIFWKNDVTSASAFNASYSLFDASFVNNYSGPENRTTAASPFISGDDLRLNRCSQAINAGDPASTTATNGTNDLGGNSRFYNGGTIDMGAYEFQGTPFTPVAITQQPPSGSAVCVGSDVTVPVSVTGSVSGYQWYRSGNLLTSQTSATLTLTNVQTNQSGFYSVVVTGSCNSVTTTAFSLTANALPTVSIMTSATTITCTSPTVSLTANGGTTYRWSTTQTTPVISVSLSGQYSVTVTNASGCSATATQAITNGKTPPPAPNLSSLTVSQGAPTVSLTASNCSGTLTWNGPNGTLGTGTIQQVTTTAGQFVYSASCNLGSCVSPATSLTITVQAPPVSVWHLDGDNNLTNNIIRPYLQLVNESNMAIPYSQITVRYWLTAEDFSPLQTNLSVYWAQLGTSFVKMRYVPLGQKPRQGAFGYIEYRFEPGAGSLAAKANSGPIQNGIGKNDWTNFSESNDYSYAANTSYTQNPRLTAYVGGQLVWGTEPALISPLAANQSLKAYSESKNGPSTNTISTYVQVKNEGNVPLAYQTLKARYFFTTEGSQTINFYLDYAQLGNSKVSGQVVRLPSSGLPASASANAYLELSFTGLGSDSLYPASSTGNIQYRLAKSDYTNFDQSNDYSYLAVAPLALNPNMSVYLNGAKVYGSEPSGGNLRQGAVDSELPFEVVVLGNPITGNAVDVEIRGASGQPLQIQLWDAGGHLLGEKQVNLADRVESHRLELSSQTAGLLLLQVRTPSQRKTLRIVKAQ